MKTVSHTHTYNDICNIHTLKDLLTFFIEADLLRNGCICIETGTQHDFNEDNKDYYSTTNIARLICKPKNGMLYSFDTEQKFVDMCNEELREEELDRYVKFIVGDSVERLKDNISIIGNNGIDLVFLDSKEFDEYHMLKEISIIRPYLNRGCIIMCDDIHNTSSVKWKKAVPYIKEWTDRFFEIDTPTGLFVTMN